MDILSNFSKRLQELMDEQGISQSELERLTKVCRSNINEFLSQRHLPIFENFVSLIEFFNCSADYILGLVDIPPDESRFHPVPPFGERLRDVMKLRKVSQYALNKKYHISASILYKWLHNQTKPAVDNLVRLAGIFECSVDFLIGRVI